LETAAQVFWGVGVHAFQAELSLPSDKMIKRFLDGETFSENYLYAEKSLKYDFLSYLEKTETIYLIKHFLRFL